MKLFFSFFANAAEALVIVIDFKNKKVKISRPLINSLHLDINFYNKNYDDFELELEHWKELCHPEDHESLINFENFIFDKKKNFISLNRRLYCGDGFYRKFCLDAFIERDKLTGEAVFLYGIETQIKGSDLNIPVMSAVQALKLIELFAANHRSQVPDIKKLTGIKDALLKLNNLNKNKFLIGTAGLVGSGKTEFINAVSSLNNKNNQAFKFLEIDEEKPDINDLIADCDIILYLMPIRSKLKYKDLKLLNTIAESGAETAVLLTQIDVERDIMQAGEIIKNRAEILNDNIKNLKNELADIGLDLPVIPVSSKFIREKVYSFEPVIKQFEKFYDNLIQVRGLKALKLIERAVHYLDDLKSGSDLFKNNDDARHGRFLNLPHGLLSCSTAHGLNLLSLSPKHEDLNLLEMSYAALNDSLDDIKNIALQVDINKINFIDNIDFNLPKSDNHDLINTPMLNLLKSINEEKLRERFLDIPFTNRRVIMLGAERYESIKLISRLMHDVSLLDLYAELGADEWLFIGKKAPMLNVDFKILNDNEAETARVSAQCASTLSTIILGDLEILAAPSDEFINQKAVRALNWHMLFAQWTPVINIDFLRINSSLQDLEHAPYFRALSGVSRFIIAYSNGGFFDDRLSDLAVKADIIKKFMAKHRFRGRADWFIYENYDLGYTDMIKY